MISFSDVTFGYGFRRPILSHFDLMIPDGGHIALMGASGIGKTTVLRLLSGLEKPRRGTLSGTEGLSVSCVFQEDRLLPHLTALENAALFADSKKAGEMLAALGLADAESYYPSEMSGGMRRRCALARALAHRFDLLILDEAFTGLDNALKEAALSLVRRCAESKMLVMTTLSRAEAEALGANVIVMD